MEKRLWLILVVLLAVSLLAGCRNYVNIELPSGALTFSEVPDIAVDTQYPVCLDERLHFGMTDAEVKAVLGEPRETWEFTELTTTTMMDYTWAFGEQEAELELGMLHTKSGLRLTEVHLTIYTGEDYDAQAEAELERLVNAAYGDLPGFAWGDMDADISLRPFAVEQEGGGLSGGIIEDQWFYVQLEIPELNDLSVLMPDMESITSYPVCLDERLHFGMTDAEVKAVLGEPRGVGEETEFVTVTTLYYSWLLDGQETELDLGFLTMDGELVLCSVKLFAYCEEGMEQEIVNSMERMVREAYGEMPGFFWSAMDSNFTDIWMFGMGLGSSGIGGDIMVSPGEVFFTCTAG